MSNELNIGIGVTGLTVTAQLYTAGAASGSPISMSEISTSGTYTGTMAGSAGTYQVAFLAGGVLRGYGNIIWDGTAEVTANTANVTKVNGTAQTALDLGATLGVAGAGLTALGDTRIAHLDADVSSRTKPADTQAAVTLVTTTTNLTNLPAITAGWLTATGVAAAALDGKGDWLLASGYTAPPSAVTIADTLLDRDMATGADSGSPTVRTVRQALRALRNKWTNVAGTYSVYKEDDVTASWTSALTTDAAAVPIITSDPAGP